jgi:hypothetical protein
MQCQRVRRQLVVGECEHAQLGPQRSAWCVLRDKPHTSTVIALDYLQSVQPRCHLHPSPHIKYVANTSRTRTRAWRRLLVVVDVCELCARSQSVSTTLAHHTFTCPHHTFTHRHQALPKRRQSTDPEIGLETELKLMLANAIRDNYLATISTYFCGKSVAASAHTTINIESPAHTWPPVALVPLLVVDERIRTRATFTLSAQPIYTTHAV